MDRVKVSVCIPAHNEEVNIRGLIEEILGQNQRLCQVHEVIVVSDGSTDRTVAEAERVDDERLVVIDNPGRLGKAARINEMLARFTGDVVFLLDADVALRHAGLFDAIVDDSDLAVDGLAAADPVALPSRRWIARALIASTAVRRAVAQQWRPSTGSYLNFRGSCIALNALLACDITLPDGLINDDAYFYFAARQRGYSPRFLPSVQVHYSVPDSLRDHIGQSARHRAAPVELRRYFPAEVVTAEYAIPKSLLLRMTARQMRRQPLALGLYLLLRAFASLPRPGRPQALWTVATTTKARQLLDQP
jgi:glycosyltransferase involved in cell wall biosynthesis